MTYLGGLDAAAVERYEAFQDFDFLYMFLYGTFYSLAIYWLMSSVTKSKWAVWAVTILPVIAVVCDFCENILIRGMIMGSDDPTAQLIAASSLFTVMKFITAYLSMGTVVVLITCSVYRVKRQVK